MQTNPHDLQAIRSRYIARRFMPLNRRRVHPAPWILLGMILGLIIHLISF